jgi:peptide/nickel transport system permease protein
MVIPTVVLAILVVFFAIEINQQTGARVFYVTGLSSYTGDNMFLAFIDFLQHILLPTIVLTIISAVGYHLSQRTYLLDEMHADYVRTARAKGLTKKQAIRKHALRASLIPTSVQVAFSIASIFTGAVMTEKIFAIHGLGEYFINCINNNNINGAVAVAAFSGACTLVGALMADLFAAALDPRIKMS